MKFAVALPQLLITAYCLLPKTCGRVDKLFLSGIKSEKSRQICSPLTQSTDNPADDKKQNKTKPIKILNTQFNDDDDTLWISFK